MKRLFRLIVAAAYGVAVGTVVGAMLITPSEPQLAVHEEQYHSKRYLPHTSK